VLLLEKENDALKAEIKNYKILYENAEGELLLKGSKKSIFDQKNLINQIFEAEEEVARASLDKITQ
jgi:hypothetical protein